MSGGRVLSLDAERTVDLMMATLAQHRRQEALLSASLAPWRGRLRGLRFGVASVQIRRQATLIRIASIVEAHVAEQLVLRFEPRFPRPREAIIDDVYLRAEDNAIGSWPKMVEHYGRWFRIKMRACPSWQRVEALTDVRNAVAHGLGELTRRMARKGKRQLEANFASIDIAMAGDAIVLSEESLRTAAQVGREFIEWLDEELDRYDAR